MKTAGHGVHSRWDQTWEQIPSRYLPLEYRGQPLFHAIPDTEAPSIAADVNKRRKREYFRSGRDRVQLQESRTKSGSVDVNGDGVVNVLDLILVAGMFEGAAAAPSAQPQVLGTLTAVEVQGWLTDARTLEVRDAIMKRGFLVLEQLLISLTPKETELLQTIRTPLTQRHGFRIGWRRTLSLR